MAELGGDAELLHAHTGWVIREAGTIERLVTLARARIRLVRSHPGLAWLLLSEEPMAVLPADSIARLERLGQRLWRPLTLVSAPAGYGKTTLVSAWLATWDGPNAWLSLDEHDSDLTAFLNYFVAAIQTMFPQACQESEGLLRAASLPPVPVIAATLLNELADIDEP